MSEICFLQSLVNAKFEARSGTNNVDIAAMYTVITLSLMYMLTLWHNILRIWCEFKGDNQFVSFRFFTWFSAILAFALLVSNFVGFYLRQVL